MDNTQNNKIALSRVQRLIGKLMLDSKHNSPCFYLEAAADLTELVAIRKRYRKSVGMRTTTNDFFFCAIGRAIKQFPLMAGKLVDDGQFIEVPSEIGLGFAVSAPQGLVVPVIKNVTQMNLLEITSVSGELLRKARSNRLMPDELYGENIVLSGLGMYGINSFFAISPPCATGIISLGRIEEVIAPGEEGYIVRKKMSVSLAANGRVVDEIYAAKFLRCVIDQLEKPLKLMTE